jgi:hypothetical protein
MLILSAVLISCSPQKPGMSESWLSAGERIETKKVVKAEKITVIHADRTFDVFIFTDDTHKCYYTTTVRTLSCSPL